MPAHARAGSGSLAMPPVPGLRSDRGRITLATKRKTTGKNTRGRQRRADTGRRTASKKKSSVGRLILCAMIEVIVLLVIGVIVAWNQGLSDWMQSFTSPVVQELDISGISSSNAVLMQVDGGHVIGSVNGEETMYPASLTKMMTAIVAIENIGDLDEKITLTDENFSGLYEEDATQAGFQSGESVRAIDLLYGALLPSGAECCLALATYVSGSEDAFVEQMNQKAEELGMDHSHFCDTVGLHDPDHYSTAEDMAILLKYCIRNDTFRKIIQTARYSTGVTNVHPDGITFYSTLFKSLTDASVTGGQILGGKTGYTDEAGYCLASFAEIGGREYILVTGGAVGDSTNTAPHIQDAVTVYNRLGEAVQALNS